MNDDIKLFVYIYLFPLHNYIILIDGDMILHKDFIKDHKRFANKGVYTQGSRALLQPAFSSNIFEENIFRVSIK